MNENNKMQFNVPNAQNYKVENSEDLDQDFKTKKLKIGRDTGLSFKKPIETSSKNKPNTKNTYINKISSLIHEESDDEDESEKTYSHLLFLI